MSISSHHADCGGNAGVTAVDADTFDVAMAAFNVSGEARLAVAVSGGADSMSLLLLLRAWYAERGLTLTALTVDHRLRAESGGEAAQVAAWCESLGVPHFTLSWEEGDAYRNATASPQAAARDARYELLTKWCRDNGCGYLCVAHHADDQVETFLLRLARGSGVDGLAAIAPETVRDGITLLRPLLDFPKAALRATCVAAAQQWIEDPSNESPRSARVRFRQARAQLAAEGLDDDRLLATVAHMRRARAALKAGMQSHLARTSWWDSWGAVHLSVRAFLNAPDEIVLRALARLLMAVSGQTYGPRFERLSRLYGALTAGPWRDATLHGCHIVRDGTEVMICREAAAIRENREVNPGDTVLWDGRFRVHLPQQAGQSFHIRHITPSAWKPVANEITEMPVPGSLVRAGMPMLVDGSGTAAVPWIGYIRDNLKSQLSEPISCRFEGSREIAADGDLWPK